MTIEQPRRGSLAAAPVRAAWQTQADQILPASSRPMQGGLGRLARMRAAVEALHPLDRKLLLQALDEATRPMTPRELEEALMVTGLARTDRKRLVAALKQFPIVMVSQ